MEEAVEECSVYIVAMYTVTINGGARLADRLKRPITLRYYILSREIIDHR